MKLSNEHSRIERDIIFTDFIDEDFVPNTIEPQERVHENLTRAFDQKHRVTRVFKLLPLGTAAAMLIGAFALWSSIDVNHANESSTNNDISDVLLGVDRVEYQSSRIIPNLINDK